MTDRQPLIVLCTAPTSASRRVVDDVAGIDGLDFVAISPETPVGVDADADEIHVIGYDVRSTLSAGLDRTIEVLDRPLRFVQRPRSRVARTLRRRARPIAQKLDRVLSPLPRRRALDRICNEVESRRGKAGPIYVIYTDGWALAMAVELERRLDCECAGSAELLHKLVERFSKAPEGT